MRPLMKSSGMALLQDPASPPSGMMPYPPPEISIAVQQPSPKASAAPAGRQGGEGSPKISQSVRTPHPRCHPGRTLYGFLLALCDGYTTANTKKRYDTFGGMMTGNTVNMGISAADGQGEEFALFATIIAAFFFGAVLAFGVQDRVKSFRVLSPVVLLLMFACELVTSVLIKSEVEKGKFDMRHRWASSLVAFAMGIVDVVGFKGYLQAHVTFMTGNIQKLAGITYSILSFSREKDERRLNTRKGQEKKLAQLHLDGRLTGLLYLGYAGGCAIGSALAQQWEGGNWSLLLPAVLIAVLIWVHEGVADTKQEFKQDRPPLFRMFDAKNRGCITLVDLQKRFEQLGLTLSDAEQQSFLASDANDDGVISPAEFLKWVSSSKVPLLPDHPTSLNNARTPATLV